MEEISGPSSERKGIMAGVYKGKKGFLLGEEKVWKEGSEDQEIRSGNLWQMRGL